MKDLCFDDIKLYVSTFFKTITLTEYSSEIATTLLLLLGLFFEIL